MADGRREDAPDQLVGYLEPERGRQRIEIRWLVDGHPDQAQGGAMLLESRILSAEVRLRVDALHETASNLDEQESAEIETYVNEPHSRYAIVIAWRQPATAAASRSVVTTWLQRPVVSLASIAIATIASTSVVWRFITSGKVARYVPDSWRLREPSDESVRGGRTSAINVLAQSVPIWYSFAPEDKC